MTKKGFLLFLIVSIIIITAFTGFVYHFRSLYLDEYSYLFQSKIFKEGKLFFPSHEFRHFFSNHMDSIVNDGKWFSRYPFGTALWLLPGVLLGAPRLMQILTAAFIPCLGGILAWLFLKDKLVVIITVAVLLICPLFLFISSTFLSHPTCAFFILLSIICYQLSFSKKKGSLLAFLSGLFMGYAFVTRQFTTFLIAIPFGIYFLFYTIKEKTFLKIIFFMLGFTILWILHLLYNNALTGNPFTETYFYYLPLDKLGFGIRHRAGNYFGLKEAIDQFITKKILINEWLYGVPFSIPLFIIMSIISLIRNRRLWVFLAAIISVMAGYFFYHFIGIQDAGPNYYYEILPFFAILTALGVRILVKKFYEIIKKLPLLLRNAMYILPIIILIIYLIYDGSFIMKKSKPVLKEVKKIDLFYEIIRESDINNALFFVKANSIYYNKNLLVKNSPDLKDDIIFVNDFKASNRCMASVFPERKPYRYYFTGKKETSLIEPMPYIPINWEFDPTSGSLLGHPGGEILEDEKSVNKKVIKVQDQKDEAFYVIFGPYWYMPSGKFKVVYRLRTDDNTIMKPVVILDVVAEGGTKVFVKKEVKGVDFKTPGIYHEFALPFEVDKAVNDIEFRIYYTGSGTMIIDTFYVTEEIGKN